jgi:hypothetical protein
MQYTSYSSRLHHRRAALVIPRGLRVDLTFTAMRQVEGIEASNYTGFHDYFLLLGPPSGSQIRGSHWSQFVGEPRTESLASCALRGRSVRIAQFPSASYPEPFLLLIGGTNL